MKNPLLGLPLVFAILINILSTHTISAQEQFWVFFTDKHNVSFDPNVYFDSKAIERRIRQNINLSDSSDFPLNSTYKNSVLNLADSLIYESRWFNAVAIYSDYEAIERIKLLPYVAEVVPITQQAMPASFASDAATETTADEKLLKGQLNRMQGHYFTDRGITGKGLRIAVFDAGFPSVDTHEAFEHLRRDKRIIETYDFVKKKEFVYSFSSHGTSTLSCIAGIYKGTPIGLATGAEFLLARTEMSSREPYAEEVYWLAAAEWADKNGADIISSSLGYTNERYFSSDMDGKTSLVSRAANMAASKGILVLNSAGNEGDGKWKFIGAPADADSVLSIGGYNSSGTYRISFSSYGPTADKRLKPNVCAYGKAFVAGKSGFTTAEGTSFSCPLAAGFAACAWEHSRSMTNMELFRAIEHSGDLYPYFDYAHGYGVPQAGYFTEQDSNKISAPPFNFEEDAGILYIVVPSYNEDLGYNKDAGSKTEDYLFYNIQNADGVLDKYYVIMVHSLRPVSIELNTLVKGQQINVSYKGYYNSFKY